MNQQDLSDINVLVVEDSKTQLMLIKQLLQRVGALVEDASSGKDAMEKIKNKKPDVVVSDIEMPEMNGYDLCKKIKNDQETASIPVILLTNLSDPKDVIQGIECKADNFITKPCSIQLLSSSISDAIANKSLSRKNFDSKELEFSYQGKKYKIMADNAQITDLLLSTYSSALEKNLELEKSNQQLSSLHLELQNKNNQLAKLIEEKNLMLGMAAHDLRNPLYAIQTYSDILALKLDEHLDDKTKRMIEKIKQSSTYMLQLVNDMLDISVIEAGEMRMNLGDNDIVEISRKTCMINESIADRKDIKIIFHERKNIPSFPFDENKIEQVLNNLLSNAIKYTPEGGKIEVSIVKKEENVVVSVLDHGRGIPQNDKNRLFETFGKTGVKGTAGEPSCGLGLAIVKKIVEGHNGQIWVDSIVNKGSTFYFSLPL